MRPFVANGETWRVVGVRAGDPRLIDRQGIRTIGTTDPKTRTVHILDTLEPPLLDMVVLHEVAHALSISYGLLPGLARAVSESDKIAVEEWGTRFMELFSAEALAAASRVLGRPVCIRGVCVG